MINLTKLNQLLANTGDMCLKRRAKEIVLAVDPQKTDKVLDAGCGDGFYLHLLANLTQAPLVGLDDNPRALDLARKYVFSKKLKLVEGDVLKMPFKNNSFDKIICSEVLEHLPDDVKGLKEFTRVLKPGGIVAITVPSHNYPILWDPVNWILEKLFHTHFQDGFWAGVWNQHRRLYTPKLLKEVVNKSGLKVVDIKCLTHYGLPFNHYLLNIGYNLRKSFILPKFITKSLNKFSQSSRGKFSWFHQFLKVVNYIDRLNNKTFSLDTDTVGIFIKAKKLIA